MTAPERERRDPYESMEERRAFSNEGWQVASIDDNMVLGRAHVPLTKINESAVILNCYEAGQSDEMHAHPGEDHVFVVHRGKLHLTGVEEGEDLTLGEGQFVHIKAGYYYRLHNPGPDPAVYFQVRTLPAKPPKKRIVFFSESARGKREATAAGKK
jgi:quercetin dioxygenase-like cupin family protein